MRTLHRLRALFRNLLHGSRVDRDLSAELESYVDLLADEKHGSGMDDATARRAARLDLGGVAPVAESVRASRAGAGLERVWQDVRYALRGLRRSPAFAAMAITLLALGIGANTAIFSIADASIFKPVPYKNPDQLVEMAYVSQRGTVEERRQIGLSWKALDRWREQRQVFAGIATFAYARAMRVDGALAGSPTMVGQLSPDVLELLGLSPRLGRPFVADDLQNGAVVLLSEPFWTQIFHRDPAVLGRTLTMDGRPYVIVGVMPASFLFRVGGRNTVAWIPYDEAADRARANPRGGSTIMRLRPGLSLAAAEREVDAAALRMQEGAVGGEPWEVDLMPFDSRSWSRNATPTTLLVLLGAVTCVLLIACANIANLLLSRVFARQREIAVRSALGATRGRIIRLFLTEGLVLASIGGLAAVILAWWIVIAAPTLIPGTLGLFGVNQPMLDSRALAFCALTVVLTSLLCGLAPSWRASQSDITSGLEGSPRVAGAGRGSRRLRHTLQAVEVALTLVLLSGAGLLAASFVRMTTTETGFDIDNLAYVSLSLPTARYPAAAVQREFYDGLLERVRHVPGVRAATYGPPPSGSGWGNFIPRGRENDAAVRGGQLSLYKVDPDYFAVAGIPLKEGRGFGPDDGAGSPPVAVIDEQTARLQWPGQSAIGQQFRYSPLVPWITVVGVAGHIKTKAFTATTGTSQAYFPSAQDSSQAYRALLVRAEDPLTWMSVVRTVARDADATLLMPTPALVANDYDDALTGPRFYLSLMAALGGLALLTAAIGLYGVLNYSVTQRSREIGVRITLGAGPRQIQGLVLGEALPPVLAGAAAGLVGSWWLTRYISSLLYQVTPHDPMTLTVVVAVLVGVALLAAVAPARRAARVDPVTTLRLD
jgi:putative ABC transport system permease protein